MKERKKKLTTAHSKGNILHVYRLEDRSNEELVKAYLVGLEDGYTATQVREALTKARAKRIKFSQDKFNIK